MRCITQVLGAAAELQISKPPMRCITFAYRLELSLVVSKPPMRCITENTGQPMLNEHF